MAPPPDSANHTSHDTLSPETIHDLRAPLTVIRAQAQMVERWLRRNELADREMLLSRLAVIDAMVTRLVAELDALQEEAASQPGDRGGTDADAR